MVSFSLERIPLLRPQQISCKLPGPRILRMRQWVDPMSRHGGAPMMSFTPTLFQWLHVQLIMIKDYLYVRIDFRGDPEICRS